MAKKTSRRHVDRKIARGGGSTPRGFSGPDSGDSSVSRPTPRLPFDQSLYHAEREVDAAASRASDAIDNYRDEMRVSHDRRGNRYIETEVPERHDVDRSRGTRWGLDGDASGVRMKIVDFKEYGNRGKRRASASRKYPAYNPLIALERQLELVREAETSGLSALSLLAGTEFSSRYFMNEMTRQAVEKIRVASDVSFAPLATGATPVFVSSEMMDVILDAMDTLPDNVTIQPHDLKAKSQFIWFEKPVRLAGRDFAKFTGWAQGLLVVDVPLYLQQGWERYYHEKLEPNQPEDEEHLPRPKPPRVLVYVIGFMVGEEANGNEWEYKAPDGRMLSDWQFVDVLDWQNWLAQDTVGFNYTYERGRAHLLHRAEKDDGTGGGFHPETGERLISYSFINNDVKEEDIAVPLSTYLDYADRVAYKGRQLAAAVVHFMQQRLVKLSRYEEAPTRAERRQAQREGKPPPPTPYVDVIKMRAVDYVDKNRNAGEEGRRTLKERHIRRGFWRNQHYPSLGPKEQPGTHKPKFIEQTVVGPEGTPIRGGSKLFAVVR